MLISMKIKVHFPRTLPPLKSRISTFSDTTHLANSHNCFISFIVHLVYTFLNMYIDIGVYTFQITLWVFKCLFYHFYGYRSAFEYKLLKRHKIHIGVTRFLTFHLYIIALSIATDLIIS